MQVHRQIVFASTRVSNRHNCLYAKLIPSVNAPHPHEPDASEVIDTVWGDCIGKSAYPPRSNLEVSTNPDPSGTLCCVSAVVCRLPLLLLATGAGQ